MSRIPHEHRFVGDSNICIDCNEMIVTPILSFDDERLKPEPLVQITFYAPDMVIDAILSLYKKGMHPPLDWVLIELCDRMSWARPDYIEQLADFYAENGHSGEPPHVNNATATDWWVNP